MGTNRTEWLQRPAKIAVATAMERAITQLTRIPSIALILGAVLFFTSVSASGWTASRRLGRLTTATGASGLVALFWMFSVFADVR